MLTRSVYNESLEDRKENMEIRQLVSPFKQLWFFFSIFKFCFFDYFQFVQGVVGLQFVLVLFFVQSG